MGFKWWWSQSFMGILFSSILFSFCKTVQTSDTQGRDDHGSLIVLWSIIIKTKLDIC